MEALVQSYPTKLKGLLSISVERHGDERGFFAETYSQEAYSQANIKSVFVQDNHSLSRQVGTVRGLHFQVPPRAQAKLVRCGRGSLFDVAVDLRAGSPTSGQWHGEVLSFENGRQLFIPEGFAHGFMTLEENTEIVYKCSDFYAPECEGSVRFDDPGISIEWPQLADLPTLSAKDAEAPLLRDIKPPFRFEI
jgi:dTDP-4-dehydrorhamnose 3,5-epimerase